MNLTIFNSQQEPTSHIVVINKDIHLQMPDIEKVFPNLYLDNGVIKGEINVCAVYDGKKLIHNPQRNIKEKYYNTFVQDCYKIQINLRNMQVYETGGRIEKVSENHINPDGDCCLGLFKNAEAQNILEFIKQYVLPFFVWRAYKQKYDEIPPWGEWSHCDEGIKEFKNNFKKIGRNDMCPCGSGKKYKKCCVAIIEKGSK